MMEANIPISFIHELEELILVSEDSFIFLGRLLLCSQLAPSTSLNLLLGFIILDEWALRTGNTNPFAMNLHFTSGIVSFAVLCRVLSLVLSQWSTFLFNLVPFLCRVGIGEVDLSLGSKLTVSWFCVTNTLLIDDVTKDDTGNKEFRPFV